MDDLESDHISRQEIVRWGSCAAVALLAHVAFVVAVLARPDESDPDAGSPVVMVDLAPIASAPSQTPSDQAPAPQVQTESEERMRQDVERKEKPPEEQIEETPTRNPEVALPQRTPDPPKEEQQAKVPRQAQDASQAAAPQSAAVTAALAAGPAPGANEGPTSVAITRWEISIKVRLEQAKRYPAQAHGAKGIAQVSFSIDRNGHVLSSRIVQSSGLAILDDDVLATLKRADPLPLPPHGIGDDKLSIVTSIRYKLPGER
jgi:periplasmic protein TonB